MSKQHLPIKTILIANRGEIAARIIGTCQRMGINTVAIYSDADDGLPFMRMATVAVRIGPSAASESYLNIPKIIDICQKYNVDAVHPGYGFLSENPDFAEALQKAGILFIGPNPHSIRSMGSKSEAKSLAEQVGIPTIPGYRGEEQSLNALLAEASQIGFPLLIKATHGGGGKGMRRVDSESEFEMALQSCQREAQGAFSNAQVMLEKYVVNPRHIEVQVFGDSHGNIHTFSERDCSLQRRHQKIIEEAPAIGLREETREFLHRDAIAIAKAVDYIGAGTVEFLVTESGDYYFLEMNTRLQVEHPITETILDLDLVELQIRVAQGEAVEYSAHPPKGHAIEVRLYAEDPYKDFLPSTGLIQCFDVDLKGQRLDAGYEKGNRVSVYYDPMLAKLIVHGKNRREAYSILESVLKTLRIEGVKTNREFLLRLCQLEAVCEALPDIGYLDRSLSAILDQDDLSDRGVVLLGLGLLYCDKKLSPNPWGAGDGWRMGGFTHKYVQYDVSSPKGDAQTHVLSCVGNQWFLNHQEISLEDIGVDQEGIRCILNAEPLHAEKIMPVQGGVQILYKKGIYSAIPLDIDHQQSDKDQSGNLNAPMPGRVISVLVQEGQEVQAGSPLVILEAMKMEHTIRAPYSGIVEHIYFSTGDFVEEGVELTKVRAA